MFKALVLRRSFSAFNRVPTSRIVQSAARDGHESIIIHRVRIRKPFLSRQRLVGAVAIATATYGLGHYLGLEVEVEEQEVKETKPGRWKKQVRKEDGTLDEVDDEEANQEGEDEDEEDYDDAILFFPTGLSRPKPITYYKGSDPEWQEFKRVVQDEKRREKIRQDLVTVVRMTCSTPATIAKIGTIDHSKGRVWIEYKFPDGPPSEFERPGYELTENLEWRKTTRDVEVAHHHRLQKLLQPTAVAGALYKDTKRRAERSWNYFAVYMGWAEKTEHLTAQQIMKQTTSPSSPTGSAATPVTAASTSPFGTSSTEQSTARSPSSTGGSEKEIGFALLDPKNLTLDIGEFRRDFQRASGHTHLVPRGAFTVHALVEVLGSKARLTMNVHGIYDPKIGRFISLHGNVWDQAANQQFPKGGR
ncbi:hypothetical protein OPT61_g2885 [Boeremia exigua]|uniref:Uncharacterized protein n=1 Tax=Boeremia exigua TaxID=749465 RepID=A0ACC2IJT5_9PLEO|nr:hypothetical protein OPT61_g2885 [Boeremia exigua]